MPQYREVVYTPSSRNWREIGGSGQSGTAQAQSWLSEICNAIGAQGWEVATVLYEQGQSVYRILFEKD